jgi:DNA end-binding protein Ku
MRLRAAYQKGNMRAWRNVTLNLALMSIPCGVAPGVREERVSFTTLHDKCGNKANQSWFCGVCNEHFGTDETVRGVELVDGNFVRVLDSEYANAVVAFDAAIALSKFVPSSEVTHMLIEDSYWLIPKEKTDEYWSLHEAMMKKKVVAIGRSAISKIEHIVCISPVEQGFAMFNLSAPDEMIEPDWPVLPGSAQNVKMATMFISEFSGTLTDDDFVREDLQRKRELVEAKQKQKKVKAAKKVEIPPVTDFQQSIIASIAAAKAAKAKAKTKAKA